MTDTRTSESTEPARRTRTDQVLLIDSGNSRVKWAKLSGDVLSTQRSASADAWLESSIVADLSAVGRVLIANVAGPERAGALSAVVSGNAGVAPEFLTVTPERADIRLAYPQPARLGVDRWVAMIGARAGHAGSLCVVDVGTAMTIDAIDADGRHLGGLITPGPDLMISSLLTNTGDLAAFAQGGAEGSALFADNTRGAIWQGCEQALAALVDRCVESLSGNGPPPAHLIATGGAAGRILPLVRAPYREVPDLVLQGLAILARR